MRFKFGNAVDGASLVFSANFSVTCSLSFLDSMLYCVYCVVSTVLHLQKYFIEKLDRNDSPSTLFLLKAIFLNVKTSRNMGRGHDLVVKSSYCSCMGPECGSQHPTSCSSEPAVPQAPGDLIPLASQDSCTVLSLTS